MLVRQIKEFAKQLQISKKSSDFDQAFACGIEGYFIDAKDSELLNTDEIAFIMHIFQQRWHKVVDTENDYTVNVSAINSVWMNLAHQLANAHKNYLQILIPVISNTLDPNLLTRLSDCTELRGFYLSDDGTTLHRVRGLFERMQNKHSFSTYVSSSNYLPRSLSLQELSRIGAKTGEDLQFDFQNISYKNFWHYLTSKIASEWSSKGELPHHLLPSLLSLVEFYFQLSDKNNLSEFKTKLLAWGTLLVDCPIDDVNHLYGQVIRTDNNVRYLMEGLISSLDVARSVRDESMLSIARWLCLTDKSLVGKGEGLEEVYCSMGVGPSFDIVYLESLLANLEDGGLVRIRRAIQLLLSQMQQKTEINQEVVTALTDLYRQRWLLIMGKDQDYTRMQTGMNTNWIRLAQLLCGAGLIERNYYRWLMPSLTHDTDPVQQECLTVFSLSHYILSEDGKSLILLDNSAIHFKVHGTFYNCNTVPTQPLTKIELDRVASANSRFHKYIQLIYRASHQNEPSLSTSTIMAVRELVNGSLYPNGLLYAHDYSDTQLGMAGKAYQIFFKFLHQLPESEKQRLNLQRIIFHGKNKSFADVMGLIERDECIAVYGQYFAQLVIDYAPYLKFSKEIEAKIAVEEMRANSRLKVYREYEKVDDQEAIFLIQSLFFSLMTRSFDYFPMTGFSLSAFGHKNVVPREANDIFLLITPLIKSGNFSNARFVYVEIMETIIKPAIDNYRWTRYEVTQKWLQSIANHDLFNKHSRYFDLEVILAALGTLAVKIPSAQPALTRFLDEIMQTYLCFPQSLNVKKIELNIKLHKLLSSMHPREAKKLLQLLETENRNNDTVSLSDLCTDFIIHRLAALGSSTLSSHYTTFFGKKMCFYDDVYSDIKDILSANPQKAMSLTQWLKDTHAKLLQIRPIDEFALQEMSAYWYEITRLELNTNEMSLFCSQRDEEIPLTIVCQ